MHTQHNTASINSLWYKARGHPWSLRWSPAHAVIPQPQGSLRFPAYANAIPTRELLKVWKDKLHILCDMYCNFSSSK